MKRAQRRLSRRDFVKGAALALPVLAASGCRSQPEEEPAAPAAVSEMSTGSVAPPAPPAVRRSIVVLGAGIAGLTAAYELMSQGHDVTVLEAQSRAGGRVYTLRSPFAAGLYAEAGAVGLSTGCRNLLRYVYKFQIPTASPSLGGYESVYHLRGKRLVSRPGVPIDWPFKLTPEERKLGAVGLERQYFLSPLELGDPTDPEFRLEALKRFDAMTMADYLKGRGASAEAVELLAGAMWFGYGWSTGSALHRLVSDVGLFFQGQADLVIQGGTDLLTQAFAKQLGERLVLDAPAVRVQQEKGKVRVTYRQGGSERTREADFLVCTVPCPPLRKIGFSPQLSPDKQKILKELRYLPVTRIYLQASRRIWNLDGTSGNAGTDLPIQWVAEHPFTHGSEIETRAVLECHIKGAEAARVDGWSQERQLAFAVEQMEKVHPGFRHVYERGTTVSWGRDPWIGGGYPWWSPGQLTSWGPELAKPEGRIFFAGEHTSALGRTLEGAVESGLRAVAEVQHAAS